MSGMIERLIDDMPVTQNWDSYGGNPITDAAKKTVAALQLVPCSDGGIGIEWRLGGSDVEITVGPDGCFTGVYWGKSDD